jgi:hypothetical protein
LSHSFSEPSSETIEKVSHISIISEIGAPSRRVRAISGVVPLDTDRAVGKIRSAFGSAESKTGARVSPRNNRTRRPYSFKIVRSKALISEDADTIRRQADHAFVADVEADQAGDHGLKREAGAVKRDVGRRAGEVDSGYDAFYKIIFGE